MARKFAPCPTMLSSIRKAKHPRAPPVRSVLRATPPSPGDRQLRLFSRSLPCPMTFAYRSESLTRLPPWHRQCEREVACRYFASQSKDISESFLLSLVDRSRTRTPSLRPPFGRVTIPRQRTSFFRLPCLMQDPFPTPCKRAIFGYNFFC